MKAPMGLSSGRAVLHSKMESKAVLMKPPFDQPILFTRLFDGKMGGELMETIDAVRENAVHVTA